MKRRFWYWLLILPFAATLYPPFYARLNPAVAGFPFFYWYQLLWVVLAAVVVGIVLVATGDRRDV
ncbi:MAG: DUF3311 domain-containing protein [Candidatus Eremiobacteraeota bacterium]|nr:DUF3311 domain-containing protein [Candidatus Eremiobacteraeota bacterium]MBV9737092.1 DUF3311 domain-containing protein [Candidatus Eremiobacteraeota bacterium]